MWLCNSGNTQKRIKKYYNKDAEIIYPPVETDRYRCEKEKGYWLSVNRFARHKRVNLQLEAFKKMPDEQLIIVGSYEKRVRHFEDYKNEIERNKSDNVTIKNWVNDSELKDLYAHCKGFITTAHNEDFGLTAIEAMASGKPVIAPREGGYCESVVDGKTGVLIDDISADKIIDAIQIIERNIDVYKEHCFSQAKKFDLDVFVERNKKIINEEI